MRSVNYGPLEGSGPMATFRGGKADIGNAGSVLAVTFHAAAAYLGIGIFRLFLRGGRCLSY